MATTTTTTTTRNYIIKSDKGSLVTLPDDQAVNMTTWKYHDVPGKTYRIEAIEDDTRSLRDFGRIGRMRCTLRLVRPDGTMAQRTTELSLPGKRTPGVRASLRSYRLTK